MSIKIVLKGDPDRGVPERSHPMFFCDQCDMPIDDAGLGLYVWNPDLDGPHYTEGAPEETYIVHKGRCDRELAKRLGCDENKSMSMEIQVLPIYLGNNMEINWQEARGVASDLGSF